MTREKKHPSESKTAKTKPINCFERSECGDRQALSGQSDWRAQLQPRSPHRPSVAENHSSCLMNHANPCTLKNVKQVATAGISGAEQQLIKCDQPR